MIVKICLLFSQDHRKHVIIRRQIRTFLDAGHRVTVVDHADGPASSKDSYHHRALSGFPWETLVRPVWKVVRRFPTRKAHQVFWSEVFRLRIRLDAARLALAASRYPADCYVAEDLESAYAALILSRWRPRPILYSAHELESEQGEPDAIRQTVLRAFERAVIPRVDHLITPNQARADFFSARYGTRSIPAIVRNCPPLAAAPKTDVLRQRLALPADARIVLYHGALIPRRALDSLVKSASQFNPGTVLVLIGEQGDYYREVLQPIVDSREVQGRVYAIPFIPHDEMPAYVASADLGVVIYENVNLNNYLCAPTKLYEFLMMQVPFIGSDFPEITTILREYPVGATFNPEDPGSIARAVNSHFMRGEEDLREIRAQLARAREDLNWENEGAKWLELLTSAPVTPNHASSFDPESLRGSRERAAGV